MLAALEESAAFMFIVVLSILLPQADRDNRNTRCHDCRNKMGCKDGKAAT